MSRITFLLPVFSILALMVAVPASTQDIPPEAAPVAEEAAAAEPAVEGVMVEAVRKDVPPGEMSSILFTYWEHTALQDARRSIGMVRTPSEAELMQSLGEGEAPLEKVKPPPEEREVSLAGITYRAPDDWTIWLNGQRVTPQALPKEALDLKVYKDYIELRWLDDYSNQILPIRLRTHQRFNVDTRIFLPGVY